MNVFLSKRDPWGNGYGLWILVAMVFAMPFAWQGLKQIDMENDVRSWLPQDDPEARTLKWFQECFELEERILMTWDSSHLRDPRVLAFARELEGTVSAAGERSGGSAHVDAVVTPHDALDQIRINDPEEAVERIEGVLIGPGPLRVLLTETAREDLSKIAKAFQSFADKELAVKTQVRTREDIEAALELDAELVKRLTAEQTEDDRELLSNLPDPRVWDLQIDWPDAAPESDRLAAFPEKALGLMHKKEPVCEDCFREAGTPVALLVALSEEGLEDRKAALQDIRNAAAKVGILEEELRLGGRPVAGHTINQYVKRAGWNREAPLWNIPQRSPILLSIVIGLVLAFVLLRSVGMTFVVQFAALYTMCATLSLVPVTGGSMNMVLVVMPTLLLVLTLSAAIHVVNYWKHACVVAPDRPVSHAIACARVPCLLAALTTAIGMLSLTTSTLIPVRDFGIYSAVGCAILLFVVLLGLPAMLQYWPENKLLPASKKSEHRWRMCAGIVIRCRSLITLGCIALFVAGCVALQWFKTETKVIRYFPKTTRIVQDYDYLEEKLAGIIPVDTIVRFNSQVQGELNYLERQAIVEEVQDAITSYPEISGAISAATFMEDPTKPKSGLGRIMAWNARNNKVKETFESQDENTRRFYSKPDSANWLYADGDNLLNEAGDELWRITAQVAIQSELDYGQLTIDLNQMAGEILEKTPGASHAVTGMVPVFLRTQEAVLQSLIRSFALAFVLIAIVMAIVLKNPLAGLITMLPNLLPVVVVFGWISWAGVAVDIGTMITASVALGIAVDGTLHLLEWFRRCIEAGDDRTSAVAEAMTHCGPALTQTSLVVGLGLLALMLADLLLVSRFGWMMSALIGAALVADLILLPALLAGPLGVLIERTIHSRQNPQPAPSSATELAGQVADPS